MPKYVVKHKKGGFFPPLLLPFGRVVRFNGLRHDSASGVPVHKVLALSGDGTGHIAGRGCKHDAQDRACKQYPTHGFSYAPRV